MHKQLVRVCSISEIPEGRAKTFLIDGSDIAIARYGNKFYAFENTCTHDGGILGEGEITNGEIECPRHGARFNITNGRAMRMPAISVRIRMERTSRPSKFILRMNMYMLRSLIED